MASCKVCKYNMRTLITNTDKWIITYIFTGVKIIQMNRKWWSLKESFFFQSYHYVFHRSCYKINFNSLMSQPSVMGEFIWILLKTIDIDISFNESRWYHGTMRYRITSDVWLSRGLCWCHGTMILFELLGGQVVLWGPTRY